MNPLIHTLLLVLVVSLPASAALREEGQYGRLPASVQRIERETGGKVLQVKSIQRGDREIYRMKVLTPDGRIRVVHDDPRHPRDYQQARTPVVEPVVEPTSPPSGDQQ